MLPKQHFLLRQHNIFSFDGDQGISAEWGWHSTTIIDIVLFAARRWRLYGRWDKSCGIKIFTDRLWNFFDPILFSRSRFCFSITVYGGFSYGVSIFYRFFHWFQTEKFCRELNLQPDCSLIFSNFNFQRCTSEVESRNRNRCNRSSKNKNNRIENSYKIA